MTIKFPNPIGSKEKPLNLSSLFLFNPDVIRKLSGTSLSGLMKEAGHESLYKRLMKIPADEKALERLAGDMARIPGLPADLVAALEGDAEAQALYEKVGLWEASMLAKSKLQNEWPYQVKFCIEIERATHQPGILFQQQQYDEAVALLMKSSSAHLLLWPEAIDILKNRTSLQAILPLRGMIALEIVLSFLAGFDANVCHSLSRSDSLVLDVLPTTQTGNKNPTALLFSWLKEQSGLPTISKIMDADEILGESLLKRWSNGSHFPSEKALKGFLEAFFDEPAADDIWMRYYGTKCLNFIGYQVQKFQNLTNTAATMEALRPWPDMPFGFKSIETWFENRYPYWFEYHSKQIAGEGIKPSPKN